MTVSLRSKIFILVAISLSLAVIPIITITYSEVRESTTRLEHASFNNIALLVDDGISYRYLNSLGDQLDEVLHRKDQLRHTSSFVQAAWQDIERMPSEQRHQALESIIKVVDPYHIHLNILAEGELVLQHGALAHLAKQETIFDFKGRTLATILHGPTLLASGEFALFRVELGAKENVPLLVYCLPLPQSNNILITALVLADLDMQTAQAKHDIAVDTQKRIDTLSLSSHGFITLMTAEGEVLAHKGSEASHNSSIIPQEALQLAYADKHIIYTAETESDLGSVIFNVRYIKALDWYVIVAAPQAEIEDSTNTLISSLISIALGAVLISILCTLYITGRLIQPLRALTRKTHEISNIDFTSAGIEESIAQDLPLKQDDEVGQLARAFKAMAMALARNIRALMDTTSIKERMQGELNAATEIQMGILPSPSDAPKLANYEAAAFLEPAKEVGGDLYDFFIGPDGRQVVIIGDVSGKGVPAALFMSMTVTLCRYAISSGMSPAEAMTRINDQLSQNNPSCMFVTLFIGLFDPETGVLEYANGGHCPPCIVDAEGGAPAYYVEAMSGPLVGAMEGIDYFEQSITLAPEQRCLLYSDGVTEAMDEDLQLYSDPYLLEVMTGLRTASAEDIVKGVYQSIVVHRGKAEPSDDITMLCFMRK